MTFLKFVVGAVLALVCVLLVVFLFGNRHFRRSSEREVKRRFTQAEAGQGQVVSEAMLANLPESVQRYLRYSGVVGQSIPRTIRLQQTGRFRIGSDQPWMTIEANEYYTTEEPSFLWDATFRLYGLPILRVRDSYADGHGRMLGTVGGLIPVVNGRGEGIDQGSMLRYLQEIVWFPAAFLNEPIVFAPIDDNRAAITFTDGGSTYIAEGLYPDTIRTAVLESGTVANVSYVAIPYNAANPAGALVLANYLLSPEYQVPLTDPAVLGWKMAIDPTRLSAEAQAQLVGMERGIATLPAEVLSSHALPEARADWAAAIEAGWLENVLR